MRVLFPGAYRLRDLEFRVRVVATNKATYVAYRGPWEAETFVRERMLDEIAADVGLDTRGGARAQSPHLRRAPDPARHRRVVRARHRRETFERAVELADLDGVPSRARTQARADGRLLGLRVRHLRRALAGTTRLHAGAGGRRGATERGSAATARLEPDGSLTVFTSQSPHGQGHHTTLAQLAADELGVPLDRGARGHRRHPGHAVQPGGHGREPRRDARERRGDRRRRRHPRARSTGSPRTCSKAAEDDIELVDGVAVGARRARVGAVAGRDRRRRVPHHRARCRRTSRPASTREFDFAIPEGGWSQATHCCWVEVDPATGLVRIDRYLVVEDCGALINPTIVEGQIAGGVAQGIGGVLFERAVVRRRTANCSRRRSSTTCSRPSAEIPHIEIHHLESPPQGPVDFRGVGEGGAIGAPAALCNAIADALRPSGAVVLDQHLPPTQILELLGAITAPTR